MASMPNMSSMRKQTMSNMSNMSIMSIMSNMPNTCNTTRERTLHCCTTPADWSGSLNAYRKRHVIYDIVCIVRVCHLNSHLIPGIAPIASRQLGSGEMVAHGLECCLMVVVDIGDIAMRRRRPPVGLACSRRCLDPSMQKGNRFQLTVVSDIFGDHAQGPLARCSMARLPRKRANELPIAI